MCCCFALQAADRKRDHLTLPQPDPEAQQQQQQQQQHGGAASASEGSFASMARGLLPRMPDASRAKAVGNERLWIVRCKSPLDAVLQRQRRD